MISLFIVLFLRLTFVRGTGTGILYKVIESGFCGDIDNRFYRITDMGMCKAAAVALDLATEPVEGDYMGYNGGLGEYNGMLWNRYAYGCSVGGSNTVYIQNDGIPKNNGVVLDKCKTGGYSCLCARKCPSGAYQDQSSQSTCKTCIPGTYQDQTGQSTFKTCPKGQYTDQSGQTSCKTCDSEKEPILVDGDSCVFYGDRTFSSRNPASCCQSCPSGTIPKNNICETCAYGKGHDPDGIECKDCTDGKKSYVGICYECDKGKYKDDKECKDCPVGYSSGFDSECSPCRQGGYQNEKGQSTCKDCPAGRFANNLNSTCLTCPIGQFSGQNEACRKCPPDQYYDGTTCTQCMGGDCFQRHYNGKLNYSTEYSNYFGFQSSLNEITSKIATSMALECEANKYKSSFLDTECKTCPEGTYKDKDSRGVVGFNDFELCEFCPPGEYYRKKTDLCTSDGANCATWTGCHDCPLSSGNQVISRDFGSATCRYADCGTGFEPSAGGSNGMCEACKVDTYWTYKYSDGIIDKSGWCLGCPQGYKTTQKGQTSCEKCQTISDCPGSIATTGGCGAWQPLASGSTDERATAAECVNCAAGYEGCIASGTYAQLTGHYYKTPEDCRLNDVTNLWCRDCCP